MKQEEQAGGEALAATGIAGLDDVLGGGLTTNRMYLIEGDPGAGKTTLGLQYLLEGVKRGEPGMYVALSETPEELHAVAKSHGWSLEGITICELIASEEELSGESQYTMFHPSEVELNHATKTILDEVDRVKPVRAVFDSLSEVRLLAQSPLRYRRQILGLKQFFSGRKCTVLLLDDRTSDAGDLHLQSIAHGVVSLEQLAPEYGRERRRLRIVKMRGRSYRGGYHDFAIRQGGLEVFPRLVAAEHRTGFGAERVSSGLAPVDAIVGGGLDRGSSVLLMGPAGSGKSSLATQYAVAAAQRGEHVAFFAFDEGLTMFSARAKSLGMDVDSHMKDGRLTIRQVDPAELSPGEFAHAVRESADRDGARIVVIDSLNGYLNAMPEERFLVIQLHELLSYLGQKGVLTFLVVAQHGLVGSEIQSPVDTSYLADVVILMRYFEARGEVRQAISVVKKRSGSHERTIREFQLSSGGIRVGAPLKEFQGILGGIPMLPPGKPGESAAS